MKPLALALNRLSKQEESMPKNNQPIKVFWKRGNIELIESTWTDGGINGEGNSRNHNLINAAYCKPSLIIIYQSSIDVFVCLQVNEVQLHRHAIATARLNNIIIWNENENNKQYRTITTCIKSLSSSLKLILLDIFFFLHENN